jgi:thiamine-phosphate pyrophosphorylase
MSMTRIDNRCRLVLILPDVKDASEAARLIGEALKGGDVASVIVPQYDSSDTEFQKIAEAVTPIIQTAGAAVLISGDSRVAGRVKADGLHIAGGKDDFAEALGKFTPKLIVGGGRAQDRHQAMEIGELQPDYIFFGKLDGDIKPEAHPKNLALAEWWASMVEIPCIVMGGTDPASVLAIAEAGAEFAALRLAVFGEEGRAAAIVQEINAILDQKAPRFKG